MTRAFPTLLLSLLVATIALAGPPEPPAPPPARDTCNEYLAPPGWKTVVEEADGPNAVSLARGLAHDRLYGQFCGPDSRFGQNRCARIKERIEDWKGRVTSTFPKTKACATAAIPRRFLWELEEEDRLLSDGLDRLATDVLSLLGDQPSVQVRTPHWATGCSARGLGEGLQARLLSKMAAQGGGDLRIVPENVYERETASLSMSLHQAGKGQLLAMVQLQLADEETPRAVEGLRFADDLLDYSPGDDRSCSPADTVPGSGPLRPRVTVVAAGGQLCEGEWIEPVVRVSNPARVQVYSVSAGGSALRIWPPPGQAGLVTEEESLGQGQLVLLDGHADSRLVAVAVPEGHEFPETEDWSGFCRVRGPFRAISLAPEGSGVELAWGRHIHVLPRDDARCVERSGPSPPDSSGSVAAIESAPWCGDDP